eukprot:scaffold177_cov334-Pavlova_lutheri.AAC.102
MVCGVCREPFNSAPKPFALGRGPVLWPFSLEFVSRGRRFSLSTFHPLAGDKEHDSTASTFHGPSGLVSGAEPSRSSTRALVASLTYRVLRLSEPRKGRPYTSATLHPWFDSPSRCTTILGPDVPTKTSRAPLPPRTGRALHLSPHHRGVDEPPRCSCFSLSRLWHFHAQGWTRPRPRAPSKRRHKRWRGALPRAIGRGGAARNGGASRIQR